MKYLQLIDSLIEETFQKLNYNLVTVLEFNDVYLCVSMNEVFGKFCVRRKFVLN